MKFSVDKASSIMNNIAPGALLKVKNSTELYSTQYVSGYIVSLISVDELVVILQEARTSYNNIVVEVITTSGVKGWIFLSELDEV